MRLPWTRTERRWRDELCQAMLPSDADAAVPGLQAVDTESFWREYETAAPDMLRLGFRMSVLALTLSPPVLLGKPTTFDRLDPDDRDRLLERISGSRFYLVRQLPLTVKLMACFAYLRDETIRGQIDEDQVR